MTIPSPLGPSLGPAATPQTRSTPTALTLPAVLAELAQRRANDEAIVAPEGRVSYADLAERVDQLASFLERTALQPGNRVGILLPNGARWIIAALAIQRAGLTAVPLNTWYRAAELKHVLDDAAIRLVITQDVVFGRSTHTELSGAGYPETFAPVQHERRYLGALSWAAAARLPAAADSPPSQSVDLARPEGLAFILFTSGSTAKPKPVPLQHGNLVRNTFEIGRRQHLREVDRLWISAPLFFGYGCSNALPVALTHGVTLCVEERVDGDRSLAFLARERCTVYYGLAPTTRNLLAAPSFGQHDLSSLRTGTTGFTAEEKRLVVDVLGVSDICSMYGLTEAYGHTTVSDAHDPLEVRLTTSGRALPTQEIRITDRDGTIVGVGQTGEVELRGCVITSYLGDPSLNDNAFRADGWLRTGDLGHLDESGNLSIVGRIKEMLKVKGINVAPLEIENLLTTHPSIDQAYVVGLPGADGDETIAAAVVLKQPGNPGTDRVPDGDVSALEIINWVKQRAASYKVPTIIEIWASSKVPLTDTGKVNKRQLRTHLGQDR